MLASRCGSHVEKMPLELEGAQRLESAFVPVQPPREDVTVRAAPRTGSWAQWETMCKRR